MLALDGGNTVALRARGEVLAELGKARQAMVDLNRVTLHERPATRAARGLALAKLGDQSAADTEVDGAVAEAPWNGDVLLHAARAKLLNGDDNAAEELARRAVDALIPAFRPITVKSRFSSPPRTSMAIPKSKLIRRVLHGRGPESGDALH